MSGPQLPGQAPMGQPYPGQPYSGQPVDPNYHTDSEDTWHRVHPISPLVRGWIAVVAILFFVGRGQAEQSFSGNGGLPPAILLGIVGVFAVVAGLGFYLSWRFTRYQVTDREVRINSGIISRQQRRARIDRVQAIDVVQPLLARVFGLAELKFDVADGGKSAFRLSFLKLDEAKRLRAAILARAAGVKIDPAAPQMVMEAPEQVVLALKPGRIIGSVIMSGRTIFAAVVIVAAGVTYAATQEFAVLFAFVPGFLALGAVYWQGIVNDFNFKVAISPDGVRLHYGMLETRSQTIPPGRVQAVGITQSLFWRPLGWYKVNVNVAGYGNDRSNEGSRSVMLPAGTLSEVMTVLSLVFPDPGVENPEAVFAAGLKGPGNREGFVHSPKSAIWIDPLAWRYNAFRATRTALLCRHGVFFRNLEVIPHERTQSIALYQGPLMSALGLVDFELHSTVGPIKPVVHHMAVEAGRQLFDEQAMRAQTARRIQKPDQWLSKAPQQDPQQVLEQTQATEYRPDEHPYYQ